MRLFALLRALGRPFVSHTIKSTLEHHISMTGRMTLIENLGLAVEGLKAGDDQAAADALADVVLAIH